MKELFLLFSICLVTAPLSAQNAGTFKAFPDSIVIINKDLDAQDIRLYRGYIKAEDVQSKKVVFGKVIKNENNIVFHPLVPLSRNLHYTLLIKNKLYYFDLGLPDDYDFLEVVKIYPALKTWPTNILKFHIQFSKPINKANFYNHIVIKDEAGMELPRTIFNLGQVLSDAKEQFITLWLEPGRQKRGLGPNEGLGSVFKKDNSYKLFIKSSLKDSKGVPMKADFSRTFTAGVEDRSKPDPASWKVAVPTKYSTYPLELIINEVLDYKSVQKSIAIFNENDEIYGRWIYNQLSKTIQFYPNLPWKKGSYTLKVYQTLEDLAGNKLEKLFDTSIEDKVPVMDNEPFVSIFKIN